MTSPVSIIELFRVVVLAVLTLLVLYPTYAYARNVMHTRALYLLAATLWVLTISIGVQAVQEPSLLAEGLQFLAATGYLASTWLFAREFVRTAADPMSADLEMTATGGGFEDA